MLKRTYIIICVNILSIFALIDIYLEGLIILASVFSIIIYTFYPLKNLFPKKQLYIIASGIDLLKTFIISLSISTIFIVTILIYFFNNSIALSKLHLALIIIYTILSSAMIFWSGIIRVYLSSTQLGIRTRVLGIIFGLIPILNLVFLIKIIRTCEYEVQHELNRIERNEKRKDYQICDTKYPLVLVHGVFFRDFRYLNYWGRIPEDLETNGATIFYGKQQSAASVEDCGRELSIRIKALVEKLQCEKVNIIAHSKGGLDSRYAISKFGLDKYVASLTTINTPHNGCIFSKYALDAIPEKVVDGMAKLYNTTLKKLGDTNPNFIEAVEDLSDSSSLKRNEEIKDSENVLYESVMSYCKKYTHNKFPLNMTYNFVKKFDGQNDGLVSVESAKWGSNFTLVEPKGKRGISHADMIDLNRENIKGFDVREFYVQLVSKLKDRGY